MSSRESRPPPAKTWQRAAPGPGTLEGEGQDGLEPGSSASPAVKPGRHRGSKRTSNHCQPVVAAPGSGSRGRAGPERRSMTEAGPRWAGPPQAGGARGPSRAAPGAAPAKQAGWVTAILLGPDRSRSCLCQQRCHLTGVVWKHHDGQHHVWRLPLVMGSTTCGVCPL